MCRRVAARRCEGAGAYGAAGKRDGVVKRGEDAEGRAGKAAEAHGGAQSVPERLQSPDLHAHPELPADPTGMACALPKQGAPVLCALVTGATGGIGRELCAELVRDHGTLAIVGRSRERLDELAKHLSERYDVDVRVFVADFAQPGAIDVLVAQVRAANLQVETLVNNAGFGYDAPFAESSLERQRALVQTNDMALMELCHAFAPDMAARGHGGILNVASVAGFVPGRTCPRTTRRRRSCNRSPARCTWSCDRTACM